VARRIRGAPEGRDALLVALTGYGRTEDRERTRAAGFDVHLVKPIDLTSLGLVFGSVPQPRVTRNPLSLTAGASPRPDR
jgi:CheY-like chemotaxis protein